jgi:hypothetical protein
MNSARSAAIPAAYLRRKRGSLSRTPRRPRPSSSSAPLRDIRGIGVADRARGALDQRDPLGPAAPVIEVAKRMFGMNRYIMDTPLEEAWRSTRVPLEMIRPG